MPLIRPKSKKSLSNPSEEMDGPKSLAVAYNVKRQSAPKKMSSGGMAMSPKEDHEEHYSSIADAILAKKKAAKMMADGGMVDLEENSEESPNIADELNFEANGKEQYDDEQLSAQPEDSNEHGDDIESDAHDMIDQIRRKMKAKKGF